MTEIAKLEAALKDPLEFDHYPGEENIFVKSEIMEAARSHLATLKQPADGAESQTLSEREVLCRALDRMGWDEINAYHNELREGQSIYEDGGGYFMRCIKRLFGVAPRHPVVTYRQAAQALIDQYAPKPDQKEERS